MPEYGLNIGSRRSVNVITPTFDRDFVTYGTLNHGTGPNITFTRASSATVFTSTGILSTVPNDVPRFEWGSFRTNYIRNSNATGAVVGVIGQGGALPTFWNASGHTINNLSATIVGTGTENNIPYLDLRINGTPNNSGAAFINADFATSIPATSGQTWTMSSYIKLASGSLTNITTIGTSFYGRDPNSNVSGQTNFVSITPTTASLDTQRASCTFTFSNSSVAGILPVPLQFNYTVNNPIDATFRIGAPQLELSSAATAFIPTTNAPVTTGVPLGLLIEESRTNFVGDQNLFNWATIDGTSPLSAGTGIASLSSFIIDDTSSINYHQRNYNFPTALLSSTTYCFSCYVKKNPKFNNLDSLLRMQYSDTAGNLINQGFAGIWFNQATGQTGMAYTTTTSAVSVQDFGTFFRTSFTFNTQTTGQPIRVDIIPSAANPFGAALSGTSIEVAGIQVEQGSFPTSYIPTAGLSATRAADIALTNDLSFYNQDQGTLYTEILKVNNPSDAKWASFTLSTNTTQNITIQNYAERHEFVVWNSTARSIAFNNNIINSNYKLAGAYQNSNFQATQNGVLSNPILNFIPSKNINRFSLGSLNGSQFYLNNYLRKVTYWPTRLSNNRLRTLTLSA